MPIKFYFALFILFKQFQIIAVQKYNLNVSAIYYFKNVLDADNPPGDLIQPDQIMLSSHLWSGYPRCASRNAEIGFQKNFPINNL